jgi:membrane protease YdiL (CAAX protease family)
MFSADSDNPWIADVRSASRRVRPILTLALAVIVCAAIAAATPYLRHAAAAALARVVTTATSVSQVDLARLLVGIASAAVMALVAQAAMRIQGRRLWRHEPYGWEALFGGLAFGFGGYCAAAAVANLAGAVGMGPSVGALRLAAPLLAALTLTAALAFAQEAFFRGWLQPVLCARWGAWPGLIVTSLLFVAFHLALGLHGLVAWVNIFLLGALMGGLALRSGGLVAPIAAHFAWWGAQDLIFGPLGRPPAVFDLKLQGSAWWSGGHDSMSGSLAMTLIMIVLLITLASTRPDRTTEAA